MKSWILVATCIAAGLFIAKATFDAGLRKFGVLIGIIGSIAYVLIGFDQWTIGGSLLAVDLLLVLISRSQMKKFGLGPFATRPSKRKRRSDVQEAS